MGHRYLQGYVFSRPLEAAQLADGEWRAGMPVASLDTVSPAVPS
jgi:EAL domain-containing protein (putative c-di-GMP-specific phosphodiesterase class I)